LHFKLETALSYQRCCAEDVDVAWHLDTFARTMFGYAQAAATAKQNLASLWEVDAPPSR